MIIPSETSKTETIPSESDISPSEYDPAESVAPVEKGQGPPSYDDTFRAPMPGPARDDATGPRVNHIYIKEANHSVKGEWTIDPTIRVPPSLLASLDKGEERVNLRLHSQNGSVQGRVRLISDQPTKSFLHASSQNGSVALKILSRYNQRFRLRLHSQNGSVTARIPSDFEGPVTFRLRNGSLKFSEAVQRRVAHHSQTEKSGKAFIGDWSTSGYADIGDDLEAWSGDELILSSENGSVKIEYAEESPEFARGASDGRSGEGPLKSLWRKIVGDPVPPPSESASASMSSPVMYPAPPVVADRKN
ncbi:hypothetical protein FRB96_006944 [Tulasnella sp. 330]|nr:hypothetical protein FRB96_006944 [Tulasnella sp. 330]KAG8876554.1 hypothetical protein FRB97_004107 [Tulasnella sp. 331]